MRPTVFKRYIKELFVITLIWMITGCASPQKQYIQPPPPAKSAIEHKLPSPAAPVVESEPVPKVSSKAPVPKKPEFYVHTVRWPGETISAISQWYTGNHGNWKTIAKVNPDFDPKRIHIGDKILIPAKIIKNRKPMPKKHLKTSAPKRVESYSYRTKPATKSYETKTLYSPEKDQKIAESDKIELFELPVQENSVPESDEIELFETVE